VRILSQGHRTPGEYPGTTDNDALASPNRRQELMILIAIAVCVLDFLVTMHRIQASLREIAEQLKTGAR
jgi:hypothetical protein